MHRIGFKMRLYDGMQGEYARRHEQIWPELAELLKEAGVEDYTIWLDAETNTLFACLKAHDKARLAALPAEPTMRKWWDYMADIMETNADNSPVQTDLVEVFHLD